MAAFAAFGGGFVDDPVELNGAADAVGLCLSLIQTAIWCWVWTWVEPKKYTAQFLKSAAKLLMKWKWIGTAYLVKSVIAY